MMLGRQPRPDADRAERALARVPLFEKLNPRQLKKLARLCIPRYHEADEILIEEGTVGLGMFLVHSGRVVVYHGPADKRLKVAEVGEGQVLGEMALIDDQPRSGTVIAMEPTTSLLITREGFRSLMRSSPEIAWCIVPVLVVRIRELLDRLAESSTQQTEQGTGATDSSAVTVLPPAPTRPSEAASTRATPPTVALVPTARSEGRASTTSPSNPVVLAMRLQYHVLSATLTGVERSMAISHEVLDNVAREARLDQPGGLDLVSPYRIAGWLADSLWPGRR